MSLLQIGIFCAVALLIRAIGLFKKDWTSYVRQWSLMVASLLAIYWLQPANSVRYMDFWLPTVIIGIVVLQWALLVNKDARQNRQNLITAIVIVGLILIVAATRMLSFRGILTATRPPQFWQSLIFVALMSVAYGLIWWRGKSTPTQKFWGAIAFLVAILVVMKTPFLVEKTSVGLRTLLNQSPDMATSTDLRWFGLSYIVFRLIATIFDKRNHQLNEISLQEYFIYVFFFPTLTAGPIDRINRFKKEISLPNSLFTQDLLIAGKRIFIGMFKKFVIADTLALVALNNNNVMQIENRFWMLIVLYAYTFQILFDFSGYTDIVLGIGKLMGFDLPENFNLPYLAKNISEFWRKWHMTLSSWFRDYIFIPLEWNKRKHPQKRWFRDGHMLIVFLLTGLWHGVTINFVVWGAWHGIGLVAQSHWSEWLTPKLRKVTSLENWEWLQTGLRIFVTFHYVAFGWIWFALPNWTQALHTFQVIFGG
jgi:D-alanyl-lipoteichoic acid acyltransferase DltB (MBOAT superfamily)